MVNLINKQLLLTAYAYLFLMEQQKEQQGSEAIRLQVDKTGSSESLSPKNHPETAEQMQKSLGDIQTKNPIGKRTPDIEEQIKVLKEKIVAAQKKGEQRNLKAGKPQGYRAKFDILVLRDATKPSTDTVDGKPNKVGVLSAGAVFATYSPTVQHDRKYLYKDLSNTSAYDRYCPRVRLVFNNKDFTGDLPNLGLGGEIIPGDVYGSTHIQHAEPLELEQLEKGVRNSDVDDLISALQAIERKAIKEKANANEEQLKAFQTLKLPEDDQPFAGLSEDRRKDVLKILVEKEMQQIYQLRETERKGDVTKLFQELANTAFRGRVDADQFWAASKRENGKVTERINRKEEVQAGKELALQEELEAEPTGHGVYKKLKHLEASQNARSLLSQLKDMTGDIAKYVVKGQTKLFRTDLASDSQGEILPLRITGKIKRTGIVVFAPAEPRWAHFGLNDDRLRVEIIYVEGSELKHGWISTNGMLVALNNKAAQEWRKAVQGYVPQGHLHERETKHGKKK